MDLQMFALPYSMILIRMYKCMLSSSYCYTFSLWLYV